MCDDNGKPFIATLYTVLLAPNLCDWSFSIITLMNSVHNHLFRKGFCTVLFSDNEQNELILPHSAQRKYDFLVKNERSVKIKKQIPKNTVSLELLH